MFKRLILASLLSFATLSAQAAEPYTIDPKHTQVEFTWSHFGYSHITGRFDQVEGEFLFDAADPTKSTISVTIPIASISTGVADLDTHLKSDDFFDAAQFPTATFRSTSVTAAGEGRLAVAGDLTIHGVTRPVVLAVTVNKIAPHPMNNKPTAGFDATLTIKRSDFGVNMYVPNVSDEILIEITTETRKAEPAAAE
jgi:polyisoprenoid-binding protein YceI